MDRTMNRNMDRTKSLIAVAAFLLIGLGALAQAIGYAACGERE